MEQPRHFTFEPISQFASQDGGTSLFTIAQRPRFLHRQKARGNIYFVAGMGVIILTIAASSLWILASSPEQPKPNEIRVESPYDREFPEKAEPPFWEELLSRLEGPKNPYGGR